jgi:hypothetical protein
MPLRDPLPQQIPALDYARGRRTIALFMEMRLGKCLVAIRWAVARAPGSSRILVIGPKQVLGGWEEELESELQYNVVPLYDTSVVERRAMVASGLQHTPEWEDPVWFLVNYQGIQRDPGLLSQPWDVLILDESTAVRNPSAKTTKAIARHSLSIPSRAILSGLPNPQNLADFFSQFIVLNGQFMGHDNFWQWRQRFFYQLVDGPSWLWKPRAGTRQLIKDEVHRLSYVKTRKQAGVGGRFVTETWRVDPTPKQIACTKKIRHEFAVGDIETVWATTREVWFARLAGGFNPDQANPEQISDAKTRVILEALGSGGVLERQPALVWFRFNEELKAFAAAARKKKFTVCEIYGDVKQKDRDDLRRRFRAKEFQIAAMQYKVGKFGQDWSRAAVAIAYSHTYDLEEFAQSRDRIVHPTKKHDLLWIDVVTRGTVDESCLQARKEKTSESGQITRAMMKDYVARLRRSIRQ